MFLSVRTFHAKWTQQVILAEWANIWLNIFYSFDLSATSIEASSKLNFALFRYSWQVNFSYLMSFTLECIDCVFLRSSKALVYIFSLMYFFVIFLFICLSSSSSKKVTFTIMSWLTDPKDLFILHEVIFGQQKLQQGHEGIPRVGPHIDIFPF